MPEGSTDPQLTARLPSLTNTVPRCSLVWRLPKLSYPTSYSERRLILHLENDVARAGSPCSTSRRPTQRKVKTVLSKDAVVVTDDRANLMIVTDYNDNLAAATSLIAALDVDKNDDVIVRVINLKNVNAPELAKQIQPLYQKLTGKQSKEIIEVSASDTANSLMVFPAPPISRKSRNSPPPWTPPTPRRRS